VTILTKVSLEIKQGMHKKRRLDRMQCGSIFQRIQKTAIRKEIAEFRRFDRQPEDRTEKWVSLINTKKKNVNKIPYK